MPTISIPKEFLKEKELVLVPRRKYEYLLDMEKLARKRLAEESAIDRAIKIYKREAFRAVETRQDARGTLLR